ncbi:MAG: MOSC domain-containing protein [Candidatus Kariarchaeaceae archaeon]
MGEEKVNEFIKTMKNRRGWYAKVLKEGSVSKGEKITLIE